MGARIGNGGNRQRSFANVGNTAPQAGRSSNTSTAENALQKKSPRKYTEARRLPTALATRCMEAEAANAESRPSACPLTVVGVRNTCRHAPPLMGCTESSDFTLAPPHFNTGAKRACATPKHSALTGEALSRAMKKKRAAMHHAAQGLRQPGVEKTNGRLPSHKNNNWLQRTSWPREQQTPGHVFFRAQCRGLS